jgi:glycerol-3-phosphate dehydrogenase
MIQRSIASLTAAPFDVLIVGSGIYGAAAAWDAATRGLSVALIDKGDFGGATSANSLKIIHGGLRYLQQLDIKRMRESIRERRLMLQLAPHLVHPLLCIMPTYGHLMKGPEVMRIGLILNDLISYDRNRLGDSRKHIPPGKLISRNEVFNRVPCICRDQINGGVAWTDAQMYNSDRMVISFVLSAVSAGAKAANYVKAERFLTASGKLNSVQCRDLITDEKFEIRSRTVLNMTGGWIDSLLNSLGQKSGRIKLSTAMNLIVNRALVEECAAGVQGKFEYLRPDNQKVTGRRILFMTPWRNRTIIGTYHRPFEGSPDDLRVTEQDIDNFLKEINSACPGDPVRRDEISLVHKGFLPMDGISPKTGDVLLSKHYQIIDHEKADGISGLISVIGVKYTTARDVAERAVNMVYRKLRRPVSANRTRSLRITGGDIDSFQDLLKEAERHTPAEFNFRAMERLVRNYGTFYKRYIEYGNSNGSAELLAGSSEVLKSEVQIAISQEMVCHLTDVILRRTDLGSAGYPGRTAVEAVAGLMAEHLNWNKKIKKQEIDALNAYYLRMGASLN